VIVLDSLIPLVDRFTACGLDGSGERDDPAGLPEL